MKKLLIVLFFSAGIASRAFAQSLPRFDNFPLVAKADYKAADSAVLQTANYLLSTPVDQNTSQRKAASAFVIKWMTGTPDYTFSLGDNSLHYFVKDADLLMLFMAAMTKYTIETKSTDNKIVTLNGVKLVLVYANNPANGIKLTKDLKKLSEANDKGELQSLLKL